MIIFENVSKRFKNGLFAVKDLSFEIKEGETLVLLGTSGCGKSTTLRMINRLIDPSDGRILVDGFDIKQQNPIELRKMIGMAIQGTGLFPHMTVEENISIVPTLLKWPKEKIRARVDELLQIVELDLSYKTRFPHHLSGGQKQRVGVSRALAGNPKILLMDEPFGALDPVTREQIQKQLLDILEIETKTVIFVTHDIFEAVLLADRIALMHEGSIIQLSTPEDLVEHPANEFVEAFLGPHIFQLSMMTKRIHPLVQFYTKPEKIPKKLSYKLTKKATLFEALDQFKKSKLNELPVVSGKYLTGYIQKNDLINHLISLLENREAAHPL